MLALVELYENNFTNTSTEISNIGESCNLLGNPRKKPLAEALSKQPQKNPQNSSITTNKTWQSLASWVWNIHSNVSQNISTCKECQRGRRRGRASTHDPQETLLTTDRGGTARNKTRRKKTMQKLIMMIIGGWLKTKPQVSYKIKDFWIIKEDLTIYTVVGTAWNSPRIQTNHVGKDSYWKIWHCWAKRSYKIYCSGQDNCSNRRDGIQMLHMFGTWKR